VKQIFSVLKHERSERNMSETERKQIKTSADEKQIAEKQKEIVF